MANSLMPAVQSSADAVSGKMPVNGGTAAESAKGDFRQHLAGAQGSVAEPAPRAKAGSPALREAKTAPTAAAAAGGASTKPGDTAGAALAISAEFDDLANDPSTADAGNPAGLAGSDAAADGPPDGTRTRPEKTGKPLAATLTQLTQPAQPGQTTDPLAAGATLLAASGVTPATTPGAAAIEAAPAAAMQKAATGAGTATTTPSTPPAGATTGAPAGTPPASFPAVAAATDAAGRPQARAGGHAPLDSATTAAASASGSADGAASAPAAALLTSLPAATAGSGSPAATHKTQVPASGTAIAAQLVRSLPAGGYADAAAKTAGGMILQVALKPENLGSITLQIQHEANGDASVTITASRPETLETLKKDSSSLDQILTNAGVPESGRKVEYRAEPVTAGQAGSSLGNAATPGGAGGQAQNGMGFAGNDSARFSRGFADAPANAAPADTATMPVAATGGTATGSGGLNMIA